MARATTVFDASGAAAFTIYKEQRIEVPLSRVSPHLISALVAIEDQRFFDHGGVDVIRVAGAAWKNVLDGWGTQGGSTITQQLARQSLLTREKTVTRKLTEIVVAARLEQEFTKSQILELYLNKVYFGDGLYGVEAASLGYLGKHAADLDVAEAALLAGLVKAPSTYAPTVSLARATARRNAALDAMRAAGAIDEPTLRTAKATKHRIARCAARPGIVRAVLQGRSPQGARAPVRVGARVRGRAEGLHDARSEPAEGGRSRSAARGIRDREASGAAANAMQPRAMSRCRPRSWRSTRTPARSARWSAAAASTTATSTA